MKHTFPKEWFLTEERKKELESLRKQAMQLDEARKAEGGLIDGVKRIQEALAAPAATSEFQPVMGRRLPIQLGKPRMRQGLR